MDRATHLIIVVLIAVFLVGSGTAGYMVIEGWTVLDSLYMTVITLSTIGYGRMGRAFCRYLIRKHLKFVVIEKNKDRIPVMNTDHILYIAGEATVEDNLRKAGIKRASNLIATLGTDADNVLLVLLAKGLKPDLYVVARASQNASKKPLDTAGADVVVSPFDIGARRMAHAILRPNVIRFLEYAFADEDTDIHIEEIAVAESSWNDERRM